MDDARHDPAARAEAGDRETIRAEAGGRARARDREGRRERGGVTTLRPVAREAGAREAGAHEAGARGASGGAPAKGGERAERPSAESRSAGGAASKARPKPLPRPLARDADPEPAGEAPRIGPLAPPASPARRQRRHTLLIASFLLLVVAPTAAAVAYLYLRAADQYASTTGFAVRTEEMGSAFDILGGITQLGGSSSTDTDILNEFIQGQQIVAEIDRELGLKAMYSRNWDTDPVFSLPPGAPIEALVNHWRRKVRISYDSGTGLIEIRALAFSPQEARAIADAVFERSAAMVNDLSAIAREDATRYARAELELAVERLKDAREAMSDFRSRTQIVDPNADLQGQMGLLNTLQSQLAAALIDFDLLRETAQESDPRITQTERRIAVIERRIEQERGKFTIGGAGADREDYVVVLAEFDRLDVDLQFARQAYTAALSAFDTAQAEAQRKSRYLAAYVTPTTPESAEHPRRAVLSALTALFLLLGWSVLALIYYSIRDRR